MRSREAVATEIWPDGEGSGTSASLRQALWLVRSSFAAAEVALDRYLTIDAEVIGLSSCAPVDLDVARFEAALRGSTAGPEEAIALYHGDLVECLGLECFAVEAERLSDAYEDALALVAERRLAAGDPIGARDVAERLLARDPLREEAHVTLLRVHGQVGSRAQVVRQYRRLTQLLSRRARRRSPAGDGGCVTRPRWPRRSIARGRGRTRLHSPQDPRGPPAGCGPEGSFRAPPTARPDPEPAGRPGRHVRGRLSR